MKVTEIHGHHVRFVPRVPLGNARTFIRQRDCLLLQVRTDTGHSGWGEVFSSPWAAAALIRHQFGGQVLGQSPEAHGRVFHTLTAMLGYDRRGPAMMAVSAIDMALHDAAARARGQRVAELLGGALREALPAYASGPFIVESPAPYGAYLPEVEHYLRQGFRAIKPRAGVSPQADGAMVRALREAVGPDVDLMVDVNQGYTASAAAMAARAMEGAGLLWIEEPVGPEDIAGYLATARACATPIAGGEALASLAACRDFLQAGAIAVLQPDITVCGGFTGFRRMAALADAHEVPAMPHIFSSAVNFYASLQLAATLPARRGGGHKPYPFIEWDATDNPLIGLFGFPLNQDGTVSLPDGPGIGIDLQPEMLEPWAVERWSLRL